jgi:hypothetical protein
MASSTYCPNKAKLIIEQLSDGIPLRVICRQEGMPAWRTVYDWIAKDENLSAHIARARDLGYDAIAEECIDIADETSGDYTEMDGRMVYNAEHVQRSKLKIETRLKLLAKWNPKKYGERIHTEHSGSVNMTNMDDDELDRIIRERQQALDKAKID